MIALFVTTESIDCVNHVRAWESVFGKALTWTYVHSGANLINNDWQVLDVADVERPQVIFWIGACGATNNPSPTTFRSLRTIAPVINFCSDATDEPWWKYLKHYRDNGCFDLQVGIDGPKGVTWVDMATLSPVDPRPYASVGIKKRDIRCGFSGTVGRWNSRSEVVNALEWFGGLTVRTRSEAKENYHNHADFMMRCQMLLNFSHTGSGEAHHIKGRVIEAGYAGCCLLESEGSPIGEWFPDDCYYLYKDAPEAAHLIKTLTSDQISHAAKRLAEEVRTKYTARHIFSQILDAVDVHYPNKVATA